MENTLSYSHIYHTEKGGRPVMSTTNKFFNVYRENRAAIISGMLSVSGTANMYPVYDLFTK